MYGSAEEDPETGTLITKMKKDRGTPRVPSTTTARGELEKERKFLDTRFHALKKMKKEKL